MVERVVVEGTAAKPEDEAEAGVRRSNDCDCEEGGWH